MITDQPGEMRLEVMTQLRASCLPGWLGESWGEVKKKVCGGDVQLVKTQKIVRFRLQMRPLL